MFNATLIQLCRGLRFYFLLCMFNATLIQLCRVLRFYFLLCMFNATLIQLCRGDQCFCPVLCFFLIDYVMAVDFCY